jgi:hypothetical protein
VSAHCMIRRAHCGVHMEGVLLSQGTRIHPSPGHNLRNKIVSRSSRQAYLVAVNAGLLLDQLTAILTC